MMLSSFTDMMFTSPSSRKSRSRETCTRGGIKRSDQARDNTWRHGAAWRGVARHGAAWQVSQRSGRAVVYHLPLVEDDVARGIGDWLDVREDLGLELGVEVLREERQLADGAHEDKLLDVGSKGGRALGEQLDLVEGGLLGVVVPGMGGYRGDGRVAGVRFRGRGDGLSGGSGGGHVGMRMYNVRWSQLDVHINEAVKAPWE